MSNYAPITDFAPKDTLPPGHPNKVVRGTELMAEFNAIATSSTLKAPIASPTFTGTPTAPTPTAGDNSTRIASTAFVRALLSAGSDIASASTVTPPGDGNSFTITGTATINAIGSGSSWDGRLVLFRFAAALTLTHSSSLNLIGGANIITAAGDFALFRQRTSGTWDMVLYSRASGAVIGTIDASQIVSGTVANARISGAYTNITAIGNTGSHVSFSTGGNVTVNAPSSGSHTIDGRSGTATTPTIVFRAHAENVSAYWRFGDTRATGSGNISAIEQINKRADGNASFGGRFGAAYWRADGTAPASGAVVGSYAFGGVHTGSTSFNGSNLLYAACVAGVAEGSFTSASNMPIGISLRTGSTGEGITAANEYYGTERVHLSAQGNFVVYVPDSGGHTINGLLNYVPPGSIGTHEVGFRDIPITTSTTIDSNSRGRIHAVSSGITIPTLSAGASVMVYNDSASNITLTQGSGLTLRLAGTATTGNRTLAQRGYATIWWRSGAEAIVSGNVT